MAELNFLVVELEFFLLTRLEIFSSQGLHYLMVELNFLIVELENLLMTKIEFMIGGLNINLF